MSISYEAVVTCDCCNQKSTAQEVSSPAFLLPEDEVPFQKYKDIETKDVVYGHLCSTCWLFFKHNDELV